MQMEVLNFLIRLEKYKKMLMMLIKNLLLLSNGVMMVMLLLVLGKMVLSKFGPKMVVFEPT
jgi:type III secretory pathway component EscT